MAGYRYTELTQTVCWRSTDCTCAVHIGLCSAVTVSVSINLKDKLGESGELTCEGQSDTDAMKRKVAKCVKN